ncbi:heme ABC transporter ATP-binding protein [Cohnella sp. CIP 111063]|uniref:ABC transporter ATP-binding protein n=1 Tax=unclassified Cohnella TaxID=2636738 RepID=UPI000B8C001C|nr:MULTISPECIES: ABC transporter ATP-binding protein [unclassified Cohnella]OXS57993.1 heme ABC transporter ATP-binding protein [Cohnella sp. CIP 111063]PRX71328.1 nucleoside ABC transporter ATP-binding protein [Cohnella sp. SGD-V74]
MEQAKTVVEMRNITKRFPGIVANDSVNFKLRKGEIHALLGENGAGKSTLMNVLFGLYQPEEGEIFVNGQQVVIDGPNKAIKLGIGMVHQHFKLVHPFTVTENIILGSEPRKWMGLAVDKKQAYEKVDRLSKQYGLNVDPYAKIDEISVGMQQRVEILKTLYRGADILIFDEPTAVLTPQEIGELLVIMRNLVGQGKSIVLITHKLKEIMAIADSVTIVRRGKVIDSLPVAGTNPNQLAEKMVGREVSLKLDKKDAVLGEPILEVEGLVVKGRQGLNALNETSFVLKRGEILGIAGVEGNGQSELIEALTGLRPVAGGSIKMAGAEIAGEKTRKISEAGISLIPEDRHKHGLVLDFPVRDNMVLETYYQPQFNKRGFLDYEAIGKHAERLVKDFDVRTPSIMTDARALSGGNQQKAIIAREVDKNPEVLIAAQPTRGLDVGAIEFIHKRLVEQRNMGKAVLLVSYELDEIMQLSDRIAVIYEGRIVGEVKPSETNDQELGLMMTDYKQKQGGAGSEQAD